VVLIAQKTFDRGESKGFQFKVGHK
jgi:hypothetical protein